MKRLIQQLLQNIRLNQQMHMRHRQQLVSQCRKSPIHKQLSTPAQSLVIKSKDNPEPEPSYHQSSSKYDITRRELYNWIASSEPTHFLTVQFPLNMRSPSLDVSKDNLRRLMARFEQSLIGSCWAKSHLPFYAFAEIGPKDGYTYHFHILFNAGSYDTSAIQQALNSACLQLSLSLDTFYLEEIKTYEIIYYCLKEVKITNRPETAVFTFYI